MPAARAALIALAVGLLAQPAQAFRVGIVNPTPVPAAISAELGSSVQRYDLTWPGPTEFVTAPDTTAVLALRTESGHYYAKDAPAFCAWVNQVLAHPVPYVIIGNEPRRADTAGYLATLRACAPLVRAHGAKVVGPGLHPAGPVTYLWPIIDAIATGCRGCLDVVDFHPYWYSSLGYDAAIVAHVRQVFGNLPVWITEDGERSSVAGDAYQAQQVGLDIAAARCAGVAVWMNFMLNDAGSWSSGLLTDKGIRKPAFDAFARAARSAPPCPKQMPPPPRAGRFTNAVHQGQTGRIR